MVFLRVLDELRQLLERPQQLSSYKMEDTKGQADCYGDDQPHRHESGFVCRRAYGASRDVCLHLFRVSHVLNLDHRYPRCSAALRPVLR